MRFELGKAVPSRGSMRCGAGACCSRRGSFTVDIAHSKSEGHGIGGSKENPQYEDNEAVPVYDTSGPYGDPDVAINVQQGLAKLRQPWIDARNDCEELSVRSSASASLSSYCGFSLLPPISVGLSWISRIGTRISACEPEM